MFFCGMWIYWVRDGVELVSEVGSVGFGFRVVVGVGWGRGCC